MPRRAADLLVDCLAAHGVDRVYCVPGESYLAALDALHDSNAIQTVVCRHESGAGFMAVGDGKLTGRPAPGHMLPSERALIEDLVSRTGWVAMDITTQRLINAVHEERRERKPDIAPGELVVLSADLSQRVRCKGEFWRITHYDHVLGTIDDAAILAEAIERGKARLIAV